MQNSRKRGALPPLINSFSWDNILLQVIAILYKMQALFQYEGCHRGLGVEQSRFLPKTVLGVSTAFQPRFEDP